MNNAQESSFPSTDTVLHTLMIAGVAVSCALLAVSQSVPAVVA